MGIFVIFGSELETLKMTPYYMSYSSGWKGFRQINQEQTVTKALDTFNLYNFSRHSKSWKH